METRPHIPLCRNTLTLMNEKTECNEGISQSSQISELKLCVRNICHANSFKVKLVQIVQVRQLY